jgi:hypothetical protein
MGFASPGVGFVVSAVTSFVAVNWLSTHRTTWTPLSSRKLSSFFKVLLSSRGRIDILYVLSHVTESPLAFLGEP